MATKQFINLSTHQVQELLRSGKCEVRRDCARHAPYLHQVGDMLGVCESVYKPRPGETGYRYRADGEQAGRYPQRNYHMPREACRLQVEVVELWRQFHPLNERDDEDQEAQHVILERRDSVLPA